jgi:hypothetical protein
MEFFEIDRAERDGERGVDEGASGWEDQEGEDVVGDYVCKPEDTMDREFVLW